VVAVSVAILSSSCATSRALNRSTPKDLAVLQPGTPGDLVRTELGQPLPALGRQDCDLFVFDEGSSGWRYARAVTYSVLDVVTLGLIEIVTYPLEASLDQGKKRIRVCYDDEQKVRYSELLEIGGPTQLLTGQYPEPSS
jgi:hypothetical protein